MGDDVAKDGRHTGVHRFHQEDGMSTPVSLSRYYLRGGWSESHRVFALSDTTP